MAGISYTEEEDQKLKEMVPLGKYSFRQLEAFFPNRTMAGLQGRSKSLGLSNPYIHHLYTFDTNFFKVPNYRNSFWAGWLAADGSIDVRTSIVLRWQMHVEDVVMMKLFKDDIKYTGNIRYERKKLSNSSNYTDHAVIAIAGIDDLKTFGLESNFGVIQNKTYRLAPPNLINIEHQLAFICGYINGDGCISYTNDTSGIVIKFTSSGIKILEWLKTSLEGLKLPKAKKRIKEVRKLNHANCYELTFYGTESIYLFELLKKVPVPILDRKWNNPIILNYIEKKKFEHPNWFKETIESVMARNNIDFEKFQ